ncbi:MAG: hypothetical protein K0S74_1863 [Chlamydiales bacterium]|jgi:hypothetical protein|nr:hypothetical protein [Chlamydiales bacterium]
MYASQETDKGQGIKPTMFGLMPGDKIEVTQWYKKKVKSYVCTVIQEQKNFITVDRGNYKDTVDKLLILQKQIKIERIEDMKKIEVPPKEKLLEMAQGPSTRSKTMKDIAKAFNVSPATVYGWFKDYEIDNWSSKEAITEPVNLAVEKIVDTSTIDQNESSTVKPEQVKVSTKSVQASMVMVKQLLFEHLIIDIKRKDGTVVLVDEATCNEIAFSFSQLGALAEVIIGVKELIEK